MISHPRKPPLNIAIYEMPGDHPDARHLRSRKRQTLRAKNIT
jgi:hypothetical protein